MMRQANKLYGTVLVIVAGFFFFAANANADLFIRATAFDSSNTQIGQGTFAVSLSNPPPAISSSTTTFSFTNFSLVITSNIANTGSQLTTHSETINLQYTGATGASSDTLIVEFLGTNYVNPTPSLAFITSNASPSSSSLLSGSITMQSCVFNTNAGLPSTVGSLSGCSGTTTGTGTIMGASSILTPNPAIGANFSLSNPFSFYQSFTYSGFTNTNQANSLSAGSTVARAPVPEPSTLLLLGAGLVGLAVWGKRWIIKSHKS